MAERLIYLPLGGAGEIGMNAYVYGYGAPGKERLILVDLGVTFGDMDSSPGIDLIMPDLTWLEQNRDRLEAIFVTHGHEDHIGALGHLWSRLDVPIYARQFTGTLCRLKLEEQGLPGEAVNITGPRPEVTQVGPFTVQFVPVSHSIRTANCSSLPPNQETVFRVSGRFNSMDNRAVGSAISFRNWLGMSMISLSSTR